MKQQTQRSYVVIDGAINSQPFKIHESPKLIKLLSENLYQDKIVAIVRELSTNCLDAQVKAGNADKPFHVKLPSQLNLTLEFRDFGQGLNPEAISTVYRHYGLSDKDNSNDFCGFLGLGAKSPFSYSKSFTVESIYQNCTSIKKDIYACYFSETGTPNIDLLSSEDTTEPTGVRVVIPCQSSDIFNFSNAAIQLFPYFKVPPKFIGSTKPIIPVVEYEIESQNGWGIRKKNYNLHAGMLVQMGPVTYPAGFEDVNLKEEYKQLFQCPITIQAELGQCDVGAGRESLNNNVQTKTFIVSKCKLILDELTQKIDAELTTCKTLYEARRKIGSIRSKLVGNLQNIVKLNDIKWNGQTIFPKDCLNYGLYSRIPTAFNMEELACSRIDDHRCTKNRDFAWTDNFMLVENDLKVGAIARSKYWVEQNPKMCSDIFIFTFTGSKQKEAVLKWFGAEEDILIKASSLPKPSPANKVQNNSGFRVASTKVMTYNYRCSKTMSNCWHNAEIELGKQSGYYVEFNNFAAYDGEVKYDPQQIKDLQSNLNILLKNDGKTEIGIIYGIKSAIITKLPKYNSEWIDVFNLIREVKAKLAANEDFLEAKFIKDKFNLGITRSTTNHYRRYHRLQLEDLQKINKLVKVGKFTKIVDKLIQQNSLIQKHKEVIDAFDSLTYYVPKLKKIDYDDPQKLEQEIYTKFPVLECLHDWFDKYADIVPYVNALS